MGERVTEGGRGSEGWRVCEGEGVMERLDWGMNYG